MNGMQLSSYQWVTTKLFARVQQKSISQAALETFFFDDYEIWTKGKLKPNNHSLTLKTKYDGQPRNTNRQGRKRT